MMILNAMAALLKNLRLIYNHSAIVLLILAAALGVETWIIKPKNHASFSLLESTRKSNAMVW